MDVVPDILIEHDLFHRLARKHHRTDVVEVFLAIQAAIAYKQKRVDVGWLAGQMMADGRQTMDRYCPNIGAEGLAHFFFLFHVQLVDEGRSDYHEYRFRRRHDGATIIAFLKTALDPAGATFRRDHDAHVKKLDRERDRLVMKYEWKTLTQLALQIFGDDVHVIDLGKPD